MGLDLTLGALIFIAALRGWFKGFLLQALGLTSLVAAVYLADPIRDFARPHAQEYLPTMRPELLDRLLWWVSAVTAAVVISGLGKWVIQAMKHRSFGEMERNRGDQGAGFLLGALKGAVVAAFLTAALAKHSDKYILAGGYVEEQVKASQALAWHAEHRPADRIWNSVPVQTFVARVKSRGLWVDSLGEKAKEKVAEAPKAESTARTRPLELRPDPDSAAFVEEVDREMRREGLVRSP